jgi:hypothetical protein
MSSRADREMATELASKLDAKVLYGPPIGQPVIVEVPEMAFLMVDGEGDPNTSTQYQDALQALFSVSYTLKFAVKKGRGFEYRVSPLEGLWWSDDPGDFLAGRKANWKWTAMIRQPDEATGQDVDAAIAAAGAKQPLPALSRLRFLRFAEGECAQVMYLGEYSAEGPTIKRLHEFIAAAGHRLTGKHHEIYLGDPRRAAPEKLKTVIRQPISRA